MKTVFFAVPWALLLASCAANSSLSDQPIIVSNGAKAPVYFRTMGLREAESVEPAKTLPVRSAGLKELKPGGQTLIENPDSYSDNGGLAVLTYHLSSIEGVPTLVFAGLHKISMQELESGLPVVLE